MGEELRRLIGGTGAAIWLVMDTTMSKEKAEVKIRTNGKAWWGEVWITSYNICVASTVNYNSEEDLMEAFLRDGLLEWQK